MVPYPYYGAGATEVRTYHYRPGYHWHPIPNPLQGNRVGGYYTYGPAYGPYNNGSPVYVTPAPNVGGLLPQN